MQSYRWVDVFGSGSFGYLGDRLEFPRFRFDLEPIVSFAFFMGNNFGGVKNSYNFQVLL